MSTRQLPSLEDERRFWDWHWQHWKERRSINSWKDLRHETVLSFIRSLSLNQPRILDLGCGPGWYTQKLADFGPVVAVDLSEEAIRRAKARFPHIEFLQGNLYEIPLPAASFDLVVSQEVFDHVEDQPRFLARAAEFLKPQGYLILSCANSWLMERLAPGVMAIQPPQHIGIYHNKKDIKRMLNVNFRVLRIKSIIPMHRSLRKRGIFRAISSYRLNRLLSLIVPKPCVDSLTLLAGFGYQFILLAQKKP